MRDDKRIRRRVRNSYIISTVSTSLVLFLLGSAGYLLFAAFRAADTLSRSIEVMVELSRDIEPSQRDDIERILYEEPMVLEVSFSSREEKVADADFRRMFGSDYEEIIGENPLLDSFDVRLSAQSSDADYLRAFVDRVGELVGVEYVSYPESLVSRLHTTVRRIRMVLALFCLALAVISLILLHNTIRLAIYSKRYLINTMNLVGATRWFIMKPFLLSALWNGLLAGVVAAVLFGITVYGLDEALPELTTQTGMEKIGIILGSMLLAGALLSLLFTISALRRFTGVNSGRIYQS